MTCAGCSNHVATTLKSLDGVVEQTEKSTAKQI